MEILTDGDEHWELTRDYEPSDGALWPVGPVSYNFRRAAPTG